MELLCYRILILTRQYNLSAIKDFLLFIM